MNLNEKIQQQGYIDVEDIKNLKFITPLLLSQKLLRLLEKVSLEIGVNIDEIKALFGFKTQIKKESEATEQEQEQEQAKETSLNTALVNGFKLFVCNAFDENEQPNDLLKEMIDLLSKIIRIESEIILNSDIEVLIELLVRTHIKYRTEVNKSFLFSQAMEAIKGFLGNNIPLLFGMKKEN